MERAKAGAGGGAMTDGRVYTERDFSYAGHGLVRPECVIALANQRLIVTNFDGGVTVIEPDGEVWHLLAKGDFQLRPNGIALLEDGSILATHLGATDGGVYRLYPDGTLEPFLLQVAGYALPPTNFVHRDAAGRTWITVSTRQVPRALGYRNSVADGFLVLADERGARIVADGLGFTNECILAPDGAHIHVNETFARRVSTWRIAADGSLSPAGVFTDFEAGEFPDGLALDADGALWIASIVSNRLIRIAGGRRQVMMDGSDAAHVGAVEEAYRNDAVDTPHLGQSNGGYGNISSLAFGGPDLKRIYLGNLLNEAVGWFDQEVAGTAPVHWQYAGPPQPGRSFTC